MKISHGRFTNHTWKIWNTQTARQGGTPCHHGYHHCLWSNLIGGRAGFYAERRVAVVWV